MSKSGKTSVANNNANQSNSNKGTSGTNVANGKANGNRSSQLSGGKKG